MAKSISYCVTVCNELEELTQLLNFLQVHISENDEIVVQYDENGVTPEVKEYLDLMDKMHENHTIVGFPLNMDFATFKNNLTKIATKDYIFQIDADEIPNAFLVENLSAVLEKNEVDIFLVPRVNTVEGLTQEHIQKWGWRVDEKGWVNFPDYQFRFKSNENPRRKNCMHHCRACRGKHGTGSAREWFSSGTKRAY